MIKSSLILVLVVLAGCTTVPRYEPIVSACFADEASYACQVERYHNVNVP